MRVAIVRYGLAGLLLAGVAAVVWTMGSASKAVAPPPPARVAVAPGDSVACLGRIMPEDGIARLSARSLSGQPAIVAALFMKEGDAVRRGQLLAVLDSHDQLDAAWQAAHARVDVARSRLAQVQAGAKPADLQAQRADVARLEAEHTTADRDLQRYEDLFKAGAAAAAELDAARLRAASAAQLLAQARDRLASLAEVRDVDVAYAEAELQAAMRADTQARAELDQSQIRSPVDGHVISIHAWPGEQVRDAGIAEIGKTDRMYVFAEVDESDVRSLAVGQRATVTGSALAAPLTGRVSYVALEVMRNDERNLDPVAPTDARVVQVKIRLDDPQTAARLINAQVTVLIHH
jgi:HlyD family secretion protein